MNQLLFIDTETTGVGETDRLCQVAYRVDGEDTNVLFNPGVPIGAAASAVTHITDKHVKDKPLFKGSFTHQDLARLAQQGAIFLAHNAKFDLGMIEKEGITFPKYICTLKLAKDLDEGQFENHQLQYLRYFYELEVDTAGLAAHDAFADILVLEAVFKKLAPQIQKKYGLPTKQETIDKMIEISMNPVLLDVCNMKKHQGKKWEQVAREDRDYLEWNLTRDNLGEDEKYTINHYLGRN